MVEWEFYSKRRNQSLESFLEGTQNLQEGLEKFVQKKLVPPALEVLTAYYTNKAKVVEQQVLETEVVPDVAVRQAEEIEVAQEPLPKKKVTKQSFTKPAEDDL